MVLRRNTWVLVLLVCVCALCACAAFPEEYSSDTASTVQGEGDGRHPTFELGYVTVVPVQAGFNSLHDVNAMVVYPGEDIELS